MWRRRKWLSAAGLAALSAVAGVAWAQAQMAVRPRPTEVALTPTRTQQADLAQARASPTAARARTTLQQTPGKADVLAAAEASSVPVLGPASPALLQTARIFVSTAQYTLVVREPGRLIEIHGTTRAFQAPPEASWPPRQAPARPGAAARVTAVNPTAAALARAREAGLGNVLVERTEYGADVSFERFGAVYSVTLVCDDPAAAACGEAAAVEFAAQLQLIGGGAGG